MNIVEPLFHRPSQTPLRWLQHSRAFLQHQIREELREANLKIANKRQDLRGVGERVVDRFTLKKILRQLNDYQRGTFSAILAGGFRSAKHFFKAGLAHDPLCPFGGQADEDVEHIFLNCPAWAYIRVKFPSVSLDWLRQALPCQGHCAMPLVPHSLVQLQSLGDCENDCDEVMPLSPADLLLEKVNNHFVTVCWFVTVNP